MPSVFTIAGTDAKPRKARKKSRSLGDDGSPSVGDCKCTYNPRTKQSAELCFVGKSKKNRTGWAFQPGGKERCGSKRK